LTDRGPGGDEPRAAAAGTPSVVVLTMARDESDMLHRWIAYYGAQVGPRHLIVLDDNSVDGSTDDLPCPVVPLPPAPWKAPWANVRTTLVNGLARGLLACYDVVIFTDVDEFLIPDPDRYAGLLDYLARHGDRDVIAPLAVNVLHNPALEPALEADRPLLEQRRFVKFAPGMCKPLVKRVPAAWLPAVHGVKAPFAIDRDLLMVHLKYYDFPSMEAVADHRHRIHQTEGRGSAVSAWALDSDELGDRLLRWVATPEGAVVPEFDPAEPDLSDVVRARPDGFHRSNGPQLVAMDENPLRQLPPRFRSAL